MQNKQILPKNIKKPKKTKVGKTTYYIVTMFSQTDNVRSRKYFKTEKEAYDYCYAQAKQQEEATPVLAEVNAKEIIEYRNSELIARKLGMSMSDACDLYVDATGKLMRENLPSLFETIRLYSKWRVRNRCDLQLESCILEYEEKIKNSKRSPEAKFGVLRFINYFKQDFPLYTPIPLVSSEALLEWLMTRKRIQNRAGKKRYPFKDTNII